MGQWLETSPDILEGPSWFRAPMPGWSQLAIISKLKFSLLNNTAYFFKSENLKKSYFFLHTNPKSLCYLPDFLIMSKVKF